MTALETAKENVEKADQIATSAPMTDLLIRLAAVQASIALAEAQQETNRHLEAIANELRLKNRVVGL